MKKSNFLVNFLILLISSFTLITAFASLKCKNNVLLQGKHPGFTTVVLAEKCYPEKASSTPTEDMKNFCLSQSFLKDYISLVSTYQVIDNERTFIERYCPPGSKAAITCQGSRYSIEQTQPADPRFWACDLEK